MKELLTGLKKSGRIEVLLVAYGYQWEQNLPWAKSELLKLGFVQGTPTSWVKRYEDGDIFFCRECSRKAPLDRGALGHALNIEYDQVAFRQFG